MVLINKNPYPKNIKADLHCHSTFSDGLHSPAHLAQRAKNNGVQLWSLTDHDSVAGQNEAIAAAAEHGISYITGIEISVTWRDKTIHIVGLGFDHKYAPLVDGVQAAKNGRDGRAIEMSKQLEKVGIYGAYEGALRYASSKETISRTHFARFLVETGICKNTAAVFSKYLAEGKIGYVPHTWSSLEQAVKWITEGGGVAVVAHPARYRLSNDGITQLLTEFKNLGGKAIEVVTGSHSDLEAKVFTQTAIDMDFYASCGSDFHGDKESNSDIGSMPALADNLRPIWQLF